MSAPGLIVAAPSSSSGKTTVTLGLLAALRQRGLVVGSFKVGPDYIDPAFHHAATGRATFNIDPWAMRFETLAGLLEESGRGCDMLLGEGVMGLFDGASDGTGATADIAALFGLPVLLVVDVTGMGASVAALIDGFRRHREDVEVIGVILNRVASAAHSEMLSRACFEHVSTPVLGIIPRDAALALPSRHLGLVQAAEHPDLGAFLTAAGALVEERVELDRLQRLARPPSVSILGPTPAPGRRSASASPWRVIERSPSPTPPCWKAGAVKVLNSSHSRRWPTRRRSGRRTRSICPAAIPSCMLALLPATSSSSVDCDRPLRAAPMSMASAAVTWRWGVPLSTARAKLTSWPGSCPWSPASPSRSSASATDRSSSSPRGHSAVAAPDGAGTSSTTLERSPARVRLLFRAQCARGRNVGQHGSVAGRVAGSFLHLIDRAANRAPRKSPA